ncbi:MAG: cellulase family glycosylhydrolase [Kiritimatiellae bacterium]|nr:cellulase family glycosylhydrolase [Kiritimatiellia bacterium]
MIIMKLPAFFLAATISAVAISETQSSNWRPLERWRGFNLLGMFVKDSSMSPGHFPEEDFRLISELGFNFVRLPMDYRFWIKDQNWESIDEAVIAEIDKAVELGRKHKLHVQLCFHRAPGYTVAQPPEPRDLFTDPEALRVCCQHWAFFSRRYKNIPSEELSFNLFNEPAKISEEAYEKVATALVAAIRAEDPSRFIMADGIRWGSVPALSLFKLNIGQAMRGYKPMSISHYRASWVTIPDEEPVWPPRPQANGFLYGPAKAPLNVPLLIENIPSSTLSLKTMMVSGRVSLRADADGTVVLAQELEPREDEHWSNVVHRAEWNIRQGCYLGDLKAALPQGAHRLSISLASGDWLSLASLEIISPEGHTASLSLSREWGQTNSIMRFQGFDSRTPFAPPEGALDGIGYLRKNSLDPWQPAFDAGVYTMVGEFGAHRFTPHSIVLAWMEDNLKLWQEHGLGWALWNFSGAFGIIDSGRADVQYENFHGHKLDRKMLDLLLKY